MKTIPFENYYKNYKNAIKWSISKHKIFTQCKRKFLYKYFKSFVDKQEKDKLDKLAQIKTLKNWQGETIHRYISIIINTQNLDSSLTSFENEFNNVFYKNKKQILEFFYKRPVTNCQIKQIYNDSLLALKNFYFYYQENLKEYRDNVIFMDSQGIQSFHFDDIEILYRPDFVIEDPEKQGRVIIFDWKTYENELDFYQFKTYFLAYKTKNLQEINFIVVYLTPSIIEQKFSFDQQNINEFTNFVKESHNSIKNFLERLKIFTEQEYSELYKEIYKNFPKTQDVKNCLNCEFLELCKQNDK